MRGPSEIRAVRRLVLEYAGTLPMDLGYEGFHEEVKGLPGAYGRPEGGLWLAWVGARTVGCVGVRPLKPGACEMKRLYVRPGYRGRGLGRRLAEVSVRAAVRRGYQWMYLDTLGSMTEARRLYATLGFRSIRPYRYNPTAGTVYLRLRLPHREAGRRGR